MSFVITSDRRGTTCRGNFARAHPELPWREMRGMRNRMAHGYFEVDLDVVWNTAQTALPALLSTLDAMSIDE
jgi:uncharacterized protein with HEPN domain